MRSLREILRLRYKCDLSIRKIAQITRNSKSSINEYLRLFQSSEIPYPLPLDLTDTALEKQVFDRNRSPEKAIDQVEHSIDFKYIHEEMKRPNVTLRLLWEEYIHIHPNGYRYSWFCEQYQKYRKRFNTSMPQIHKGGDKAFCDFGGAIKIYDKSNRNWRDAYLFVFCWGASHYTYAELFYDQTVSSWLNGCVHAIHYSQCVPNAVIPDQPKPIATKADRYEPELNPAMVEFGRYYNTTIFPARPRKPKDKAKAENCVRIAKMWILARLRNKVFYSLGEANESILDLVRFMNEKPKMKSKKSRRQEFEYLDKPNASPVPQNPLEISSWKKARVNIDYHIEYDEHYYSVPYIMIQQPVEIRATARMIEVYKFNQNDRIAVHKRSYGKGLYTTLPEHRPPAHQEMLKWTPERIMEWAGKTGVYTKELVTAIMDVAQYPEQGYRACLGVIRLNKKYPGERLESACKRALVYGNTSYQGVKNILLKNLDMTPLNLEIATPVQKPVLHSNIRGAKYYLKKQSIRR